MEGDDNVPKLQLVCCGFTVRDFCSSKLNKERKGVVELRFQYLVQESLQSRYRLLNPVKLKWTRRRAITKTTLTAGAIVNGFKEDVIRWYVEEAGLAGDKELPGYGDNADSEEEDEPTSYVEVFEDFVIRDAKCERIIQNGKLVCIACAASRKVLIRRCTTAVEIRSTPHHKNTKDTVLERDPSLMKQKVEKQSSQIKDLRRNDLRKEVFKKRSNDGGVMIPVNGLTKFLLRSKLEQT